MDRQAVFDKVAKHLLKQNKQSADGSSCQYRSSTGLKCAIGCLIPENLYLFQLDSGLGTSIYSPDLLNILQKSLKLSKPLTAHDIGFLINLQIIHDHQEPSEWKKVLSTFARTKRLNQKALNGE